MVRNNHVTEKELPKKPVIGTRSPRRIEACGSFYPDADFKEIRGNIDTRNRFELERRIFCELQADCSMGIPALETYRMQSSL